MPRIEIINADYFDVNQQNSGGDTEINQSRNVSGNA